MRLKHNNPRARQQKTLRHGLARSDLRRRRRNMSNRMRGQRQRKQITSMQHRGRLQCISNCIPPYLFLCRLVHPRRLPFRPIHVEIAVLRAPDGAIGPVREAAAKLGMHLVQLPQRFCVEVDVDRVQANWHDIVYAHFDGRVATLGSIRGEGVQDLGE